MSSRTLHLVACAALALALTMGSAACRRADAPLPSTDAPLALLAKPLLGGGTLDVASLQGKVVLVNFWSPG